MRPASRLFDLLACIGPCLPGKIIYTHNHTVFINNLPAAAMGDITNNCCYGVGGCWCPNFTITGSYNTFITNRPACRLGDLDTHGVIITGSFDTFIGG